MVAARDLCRRRVHFMICTRHEILFAKLLTTTYYLCGQLLSEQFWIYFLNWAKRTRNNYFLTVKTFKRRFFKTFCVLCSDLVTPLNVNNVESGKHLCRKSGKQIITNISIYRHFSPTTFYTEGMDDLTKILQVNFPLLLVVCSIYKFCWWSVGHNKSSCEVRIRATFDYHLAAPAPYYMH